MLQIPVPGAGAEGGGVQPCAAPGRLQVLPETGLQFLHPGPATTRYTRYRTYFALLTVRLYTGIQIPFFFYTLILFHSCTK
jgi:hypothetical protein